jgi:hypothetical protein
MLESEEAQITCTPLSSQEYLQYDYFIVDVHKMFAPTHGDFLLEYGKNYLHKSRVSDSLKYLANIRCNESQTLICEEGDSKIISLHIYIPYSHCNQRADNA